MNEIIAENKRLKAEVEKLISENMELMGVIRALRANAREAAEECRSGKCGEGKK